MDVVPYITELYTTISKNAGDEFARSATGRYIIHGGEKDTTNTDVPVRIYGFNLKAGTIGTGANAKTTTVTITNNTDPLTPTAGGTDSNKGSYLNLVIGSTVNSGDMSITVNGVGSLNNINANPQFTADATSANANSTAMYNSRANGKTNDRLTDDVELWVWQFDKFLEETDITSPMLKMDKAGRYYMSYGYSVNSLVVSNNGDDRAIDYSYNKFHNTNVIYDDNGNLYAVATNTDRIQSDSARYVFYTSNTDNMPDETEIDVYTYQRPSKSKRHLEMAYNEETLKYDINRVKRPKLASYTDGSDTYLATAYYDYNNLETPVKFRFGKKSGGSKTFTTDVTNITFTYNPSLNIWTLNMFGQANSSTVAGWTLSSATTDYSNKYIKIGNKYYRITGTQYYSSRNDASNNRNAKYYYSINEYNSTQQFISDLYTYSEQNATLTGGIMNSLEGGGYTTMNITATSSDGYHTIASKDTAKSSGEYVAVGIVPVKDTDDTVTGYVGVVAWYDAYARKVCYSYNESPETETADATTTWQQHAVYLDEEYTGWYVDLAVDDGGGIHIAYYNSAKGDLKYVYLSKYDATPSEPISVDSYLSVGTNITVNIRKQGVDGVDKYVPYIYYYNASSSQTSNSIKVAWRKDFTADAPSDGVIDDKFTGAWESMTVPSSNIPVDATVCGGVPSTSTTEANNKTVFLGYMSDVYYEKAFINGDITQ